jgi:hypothetical protein
VTGLRTRRPERILLGNETICCSNAQFDLINWNTRMMTLTGKESPELTQGRTKLAGRLAALAWEHQREKTPDAIQWAPRTVVYTKEIDGIIGAAHAG